ncbi:hypothetical protein COL922a_005539 [Colletotrichum nupharicola]|nr:hypothetical protein COL922a_005539 [Colletotrichum nupharicola]
MLLKSAVLVCLLPELGLAKQKRQAEPSPILSSISIPPRISTGTGDAVSSAAPTGIFLNTSAPAVPAVTTLTEVATVTSTNDNNVTVTDVITTERTVAANPVTIIEQPKIIIISQQTFFNFISGLGGAPPAVQQGEQGGFQVGGQQFGQFQSACKAACNMQFTQCQSVAGQNFAVTQCQTQLIACNNAANEQTTVTVSVPVTLTQTVVVPPSGTVPPVDGGSVIATTTLPPDAGATVGTGGVTFVSLTAAPSQTAAVPETTAAVETTAIETTVPDATGGQVVSTIFVTRSAGGVPPSGPEGTAVSSADAVASSVALTTSAVVTTVPDATGGQVVSTIFVTRSAEVPAASEAVGSAATSAVVSTLPAESGQPPKVTTIFVTGQPPAPTNEPGVSDQGSVVTSAVVSTLPAITPGGEPVVSTVYVTATVPAAAPSAPAASEPVTSVISMTLAPPSGSPVVSLVTITLQPTAGPSGTAPVTSAVVSTLPAESGLPPKVTTVYVTAPAPTAPPAGQVSVITVTLGDKTGVVTISPSQTGAIATTIASALPSAGAGSGGSGSGGSGSGSGGSGSGNGGSVGDEGSCPSAVTVTVTASSCPTAVTSVLTATVSVVPTEAPAAKKRSSEEKREAAVAHHQRRHGRAFGFF